LEEREAYLARLRGEVSLSGVVLATCDRVEVYHGQGWPEAPVVRHLFRVTAGLESPFLGEHQIQGQVKRAYLEASLRGCLDSGLHRLFQSALRAGKRIRTETGLGQGAVGHSRAVVELLLGLPVPLDHLNLLVIGVNHLNTGLLRFLVRRGHRSFLLGNRTLEAAQAVVDDLGVGEALPLDRLTEVLPRVDAVVSATSAPHLIVRADQVPVLGGPRWYFDLAVPRDIDPVLSQRPGVRVYNVGDLERVAGVARESRQAEVLAAERIIAEEEARFFGASTTRR